MLKGIVPPLKVFYDGACGMCTGWMLRYRGDRTEGLLTFENIAGDDFRAEDYQRTKTQFSTELHVLDANGTFYRGVDGLAAIWQVLPNRPLLRIAAAVITFPPVHPAARGVYRTVARYRGHFGAETHCAINLSQDK